MSDYNLKILLTANGETTTLDPVLGTPASVELSGLTADTEYEVEIILQSDGSNIDVASDTETFRTLSGGIDENTPFYLENLTNDGATFHLLKEGTPELRDLSYSLDGQTWNPIDWESAYASVPAYGRIYLRSSNGFQTDISNRFELIMSRRFKVGGNVMSLLDYNDLNAELTDYCFYGLLKDNTNLVDASSLILPAKTLTKLCYDSMFRDCTNLTTTPKLPATTLAQQCYDSMFYGCTSLTTAPELPATTLDPYCYQGMFQNCTSLTTAPELPATTLAYNCYDNMFNGCTNLQSVTTYVIDWNNTTYSSYWLENAGTNAENPTIYCPANSTLKDYANNNNGIPTGWTQVDLPTE